MKKSVFILTGFILSVFSGYAQNEKETTNPNEQIIVNKEYDENGNIIGYDSTYVNSWSSDSSYNFNFDDKLIFGDGFPDMSQFLNDFFGDSAQFHSAFPPNFFSSPFNEEEFFKNFGSSPADSSFIKNFKSEHDSIFNFQHNFTPPDLKDLQEKMKEHFKNFDFMVQPKFNNLNDEQLKELEELQKRHEMELEELQKKWNNQNNNKQK